jgi:hypothetical protein
LPRIIVVLVLVAGAGWARWTIRLETELLALFPRELPSVRGLDRFQRQFVSDREAILVLDEALPGAGRDGFFRSCGQPSPRYRASSPSKRPALSG